MQGGEVRSAPVANTACQASPAHDPAAVAPLRVTTGDDHFGHGRVCPRLSENALRRAERARLKDIFDAR